MQVSFRWISKWVDTSGVDPVAFAQRFTCAVAEIDGVHRWGFGLDEVVVGDVLSVQPHPNADKLRLATVELGGRQTTVVCGAPDLRAGMRVPFVPVGVTLPSGITVRDGEVRGVPSPGMLASEADLGLSDNHDGLLSLDGVTAPAGTPLPQAIELQDVLYEVDNKSITHRPDLWGQYGMAREVAALLQRPLQPLDTYVPLGQGAPLDVAVQAPDACPRYLCARIGGARVAASPVDVRLLLRRLGVRPINGIVDATNLAMLETGNPLHAFDARQIRGEKIVVRRADAGETVETLDGQTRKLTAADLVIADGAGPVALAGVMGGANSEIAADTTDVILEAAAFDAATIRKTAMRLGMRTESSARFEKALDPALAEVAAKRFLKLLLQFCPQAAVQSALLDAGPFAQTPQPRHQIATSTSYVRARLGVSERELTDEWLVACLQRLEFGVELAADGGLTVAVPTFRATKDIRIAEDIVEELGRHFGYSNISSDAPKIAARPPVTAPTRLAERQIRQTLVLQEGLTELLQYGFDHEGHRQRLGLAEPDGLARLGVRNEISAEHSFLRRNLAPNLLACAEANLARGDGKTAAKEGFAFGAFELGRVFVPAAGSGSDAGVPMIGMPQHAGAKQDAWFALMDADMRGAVQQTVASNRPLPWQPLRLGVVCGERLGGGAEGSKRAVPEKAVSQRVFAQAVSALQAAAKALGKGELNVVSGREHAYEGEALADQDCSWQHPRRVARVFAADGTPLGLVALLHPLVRHRLDQPAEIAVAEIDVLALAESAGQAVKGHAPAKFAAASVDVTGKLPRAAKQADVAAAIAQAVRDGGLPLESAAYLYEMALPDGTRSVTFRVACRAADRTLSAADLASMQQAAQQAMARFEAAA